MNKTFFTIFSALFGLSLLAETAFVPGIVNADKLNFRLGPGVKEPVAGSLAQKSAVRILKVHDAWLEIEAPENMLVFVSEARINHDGTLSGELNMRTAMSAKAPLVGVLAKGTKVERTELRRNGWVQIKVPASAKVKVFVAGFFVDYDSSKFDSKGNIAGTVPAAAEKSAETPAAPAAPAEKSAETPAAPAAPEKAVEAPAAPVDENVELQGVLVRWKYSTEPRTEFVLLTAVDGINQGFITCEKRDQLTAAENKQVKISGKSVGRFGNNGAIIVNADKITVL